MDIPDSLKIDVLGAVFNGLPARSAYYDISSFRSRERAERFMRHNARRIKAACRHDDLDETLELTIIRGRSDYAIRVVHADHLPLELNLDGRVAPLFLAHGLKPYIALPCVDFVKKTAYADERHRPLIERAGLEYRAI
jgi:hypothetical protein